MSNARKLADNLPTEGSLSGRNVIVNGAMQVAQRGTSSTMTSTGYTNVDRFSINRDFPTGVTSISTSQDSDAPSGFANSLKIEPDQARTAALSSADRLFLNHVIEAQNLQHLDYNTSSAKTITLSFFIKSNLTGVVSVEISADDSTDSNYQYYHESVTINAANTWEYKTVSIAGNVNNPINDDNGGGIGLTWVLAAGPVFTSGTFGTGSWHDTTAGDRASSSNIDIYSSASNYVKLTGVQLEIGPQATPFEHEPVGVTLSKCQRYYQTIISNNQNGTVMVNRNRLNTNEYSGTAYAPSKMRGLPNITSTGLDRFHKPGVTYDTISTLSVATNDTDGKTARVNLIPTTNHTDVQSGWLGSSGGSGKIIFDAEL